MRQMTHLLKVFYTPPAFNTPLVGDLV